MSASDNNHLRTLPAVDKLLSAASSLVLVERYGREAVLNALRVSMDTLRAKIRAGEVISHDV
jgi:hypothetical protein